MSDPKIVRVRTRRRVIVDGRATVVIRAVYMHVGRRFFSVSFDTGRIS